MLDSRFPEDIKQQIRNDAMFGINTVAALTGRRNNVAVQALHSFGLI